MRDRFVKSPDSLSNHELLELALFYAVPRVNVNPLAHTLINKYGSLSAVIHTPAEDLKQIDGVGDSVAVYLNMLGKISDRSPIGSAMIGAKEGDLITVNTPDGELKFKILSVSRTKNNG